MSAHERIRREPVSGMIFDIRVAFAGQRCIDGARYPPSMNLSGSSASSLNDSQPAVTLVYEGRVVYQRVLTWIINKVSRTILKSAFVAIGFLVTGRLVMSALGIIVRRRGTQSSDEYLDDAAGALIGTPSGPERVARCRLADQGRLTKQPSG